MISFFQEKLWEVQELLSCELSQNKNLSGYGTVQKSKRHNHKSAKMCKYNCVNVVQTRIAWIYGIWFRVAHCSWQYGVTSGKVRCFKKLFQDALVLSVCTVVCLQRAYKKGFFIPMQTCPHTPNSMQPDVDRGLIG